VLEPTTGNIAYVPDLGMDLIRQFHFEEETGTITPCGVQVSGVKAGGRALGPRYMFFGKLGQCYCVNELSSQVTMPLPSLARGRPSWMVRPRRRCSQ
tara:strand:- start:39 stop:329 length:291 start_codon:yes stop_codon:yes gene_type:complete